MRILIPLLVGLLATAIGASEYSPEPVRRSAAEIEFRATLAHEHDPAKRMVIAQDYVSRHPDDIPLGRYACEIVRRASKSKGPATAYFKRLAEEHPNSIGAQYYFARMADDTLVWAEKAQWALAQDSTSSWAWLMWMAAEWHKKSPDLDKVFERVSKSVSLDPSRPEGYVFLGQAYEERKQFGKAVEAYEAAIACDSLNWKSHASAISARLTLKEEERNPTAFDLADEKALIACRDHLGNGDENGIETSSVRNDGTVEARPAEREPTKVDLENLLTLETMVTPRGWPSISRVGREPASIAVKILLRSPLEAQRRYLPVVEQAATSFEIEPKDWAIFHDLVMKRSQKAQRFGSQVAFRTDGKLEFYELEDAALVDRRRAEVGMEPLQDYAEKLLATHGREVVFP